MVTNDTKAKIKEMLIRRLRLNMPPEEIKDDDPLFGPDGGLDLDSIDALELVVALQKEFGVVIADKSAAEKILVSVTTIADFVDGQ